MTTKLRTLIGVFLIGVVIGVLLRPALMPCADVLPVPDNITDLNAHRKVKVS